MWFLKKSICIPVVSIAVEIGNTPLIVYTPVSSFEFPILKSKFSLSVETLALVLNTPQVPDRLRSVTINYMTAHEWHLQTKMS